MSDSNRTLVFAILILACQFLVCGDRGPAEIYYGQDQCDYCKMTIADKSFGSEMITAKGKVYKFDSIECLAAYQITSEPAGEGIRSMWVTDFNHPGSFLDTERAVIVATERQRSPMGVGLVAVDSPPHAERLIETVGGKTLQWSEVRALVVTEWHLHE